jgi:gas vesicle protein
MGQFLKDLPIRLRSDRKTQVIAGFLVVGMMYLSFADNSPRRARKAPKPKQEETLNDPNERWTDLIERFNGQLNQLTTQSNALREDVDSQKKAMKEFEETTAEIFKKLLERMAELQNAAGSTQPASTGPRNIGDVTAPDLIGAPPEELEGLGTVEEVAAPPAPPVKPKLAALMPGDSVRVKLLAGVNAPTDGTPYPVVLKLISNVMGPDGNAVPLGEARIIAAAQGSLTDSRVLFRLTRLSIRLPSGKRKEFPIDGWIVGEDGIRGLEGVLIDPIGKAIVGAGMAGGLAGLGQGIAAANVQNRVYANGNQYSTVDSGDVGKYAGGVALSSTATEWQAIIKDRLSQLVPVVQVLSGREATAVFSQSIAIPELLEQLDEEDPSVVYASLD